VFNKVKTLRTLLPDEPIDNATRFRFDEYSKVLSSIINDPNLQTPFNISIYGEWGSGKTSLMKTIQNALINNPSEVKVKTIWFSAWEFQKLSAPLWSVFLNRILMGLQDMMQNEVLKVRLKDLSKGFLILSSDILLSKTIGLRTKDIEDIKEKVWQDIEKFECLRAQLSKNIEDAIKNDPQGRTRIVIFIDDLDRCLPEQCIDIFESIKLFLNCEKCVFVIGVDKDQIRKIFNQKLNANEVNAGLNYVEKFTQLEFELPPKAPIDIYEFILSASTEKIEPKILKLISKFIEPNPRKIKRWVNSVMFIQRLFEFKQKNESANTSLITIWLFLKTFFPDFAGSVASNPQILTTSINIAKNKIETNNTDILNNKKLLEFLSLLDEDTIDLKQLELIVYLSTLTSFTDSQEIKYKSGEVKSWIFLANGARMKGDYEKAEEFYKKALDMAKQHSDKNVEGLALGNMGILYIQKEKKVNEPNKIARMYFDSALKIAKELGDEESESIWLNELGYLFYDEKNYLLAIRCFIKARDLMSETGNFNIQFEIKNKLIKIHDELGKDEFRRLSEKAHSNIDSLNDDD
jgi:tetratricopeptide (TPR) repeat protein